MIKTVKQKQWLILKLVYSNFKYFGLLVFALLVIDIVSFGQDICFTIKDSISGNTIPYCNVLVNNSLGLVCNNNGQFCIKQNKYMDSLEVEVSNIAYFAKHIEFNEGNQDSIILLIPKEHDLPEVSINWSKYKFSWIGFKAKDPEYYFNFWRFCQTGLVFPPNKKGNAIFEEITVPIKNENIEKVPFRLHIFSIDSLGGVGDELLPVNVFGDIGVYDKRTVSIEVLKYQIQVPREGFIVTIELLSNNKPNELILGNNKYYEKYNNEIGFVYARNKYRKYRKVSAWKPNSFYVEEYPYTNAYNVVAGLPLIKVKTRRIRE